jgi:hypothetical protein
MFMIGLLWPYCLLLMLLSLPGCHWRSVFAEQSQILKNSIGTLEYGEMPALQ